MEFVSRAEYVNVERDFGFRGDTSVIARVAVSTRIITLIVSYGKAIDPIAAPLVVGRFVGSTVNRCHRVESELKCGIVSRFRTNDCTWYAPYNAGLGRVWTPETHVDRA